MSYENLILVENLRNDSRELRIFSIPKKHTVLLPLWCIISAYFLYICTYVAKHPEVLRETKPAPTELAIGLIVDLLYLGITMYVLHSVINDFLKIAIERALKLSVTMKDLLTSVKRLGREKKMEESNVVKHVELVERCTSLYERIPYRIRNLKLLPSLFSLILLIGFLARNPLAVGTAIAFTAVAITTEVTLTTRMLMCEYSEFTEAMKCLAKVDTGVEVLARHLKNLQYIFTCFEITVAVAVLPLALLQSHPLDIATIYVLMVMLAIIYYLHMKYLLEFYEKYLNTQTTSIETIIDSVARLLIP
ncbi:MAG: hypothetical protein DRJ40_03240 [Thermoprotei archaeon]|nr:MAG: hypothetical protein DRJ40_03240 [Thermoprotei archaeon]